MIFIKQKHVNYDYQTLELTLTNLSPSM